MRNVYFFMFLVIIVGCSKDNEVEEQDKLIGNWQFVEFCKDNGSGDVGCNTYEDGPVIELHSTGDFQHNGNNEDCMAGSFTSTDGKLTLRYESNECAVNDGVFVYDYTIEGQELILLASEENLLCVELCYETLRKIGSN